jgi:hypothetical protein
MQKFKLPAKAVKAANLFRAVNDCRNYLNGFLVTSKNIISSCGHTLISVHLNDEIENHEPKIIRTVGNIPAKSYEVEFVISEGGKDGTAFCRCLDGRVLGVIYFEVIEGEYIKRARDILENKTTEPVTEIGINVKYLDRLYSAAKILCISGRYGYTHAAASFNGETGAMRFELKGIEHKATVIIMPCRL